MFLRSSGFNGVIQGQNKLFACKIINNSELVLLIFLCFSRWLCVFGNESMQISLWAGFGPQSSLRNLATSFYRHHLRENGFQARLKSDTRLGYLPKEALVSSQSPNTWKPEITPMTHEASFISLKHKTEVAIVFSSLLADINETASRTIRKCRV